MFKFDWLYMVFLLPLPLFFYYLLKPSPMHGVSIKLPFFKQLDKFNALNSSNNIFTLNSIILWLAWSALVVASMKPVWVDNNIDMPIKGRDIILSIDLSGSMKTRDFILNNRASDRLSIVKAAALEFIKARKNDRLGLIVFGSEAFLYAPLTFDKKLIEQYLLQSQINMAGEKTAIGDAIILAIKHFKDNDELKNENKTMILLTDGENTAGNILVKEAAQIAKEQDIKIYTIGLSGNTNSWFDYGVDEETLKYIANQTGGLYFKAQDTSSLYKIYDRLDKLESTIKEHQNYRPQTDLFYYPLMLFLVMIVFISLRKSR